MLTCHVVVLTCHFVMLTFYVMKVTCHFVMLTCHVVMLTCHVVMLTLHVMMMLTEDADMSSPGVKSPCHNVDLSVQNFDKSNLKSVSGHLYGFDL